jgi:proteasome lid subunit RPN8/RPN11
MLLGSADRIVEAVEARNLSDDPNRFVIDPRDHIATRRTGRERGLEVVGFYHSHPHSDATPSPTDISQVTYDECLYLIVSLVSEPAVRLFRMARGGPRELAMRIEPD